MEFNQDTNGTYSGAIGGAAGTLVKSGTGTLKLTGTNTFTQTATPGTQIQEGTLTGNTVSFSTSSDIRVDEGAVVHFDQNADGTFNDIISGTGSVLKTAPGVLTLAAVNTYTGGTTVSAGAITGTVATHIQGDIVNNATVNFNTAGGTYAGDMSGTGLVNISAGGAVIYTGLNTYTGRTTLSVANTDLSGTTLTIPGDVVATLPGAAGNDLIFTNTFAGTYAGALTGQGNLSHTGTGSVTLTGNNTFDGTTTLAAAAGNRLIVSTGTLPGNGITAVGAAAVLEFDQSTTGTFGGQITGAGLFEKSGTGSVRLTGDLVLGTSNTFSGGITINAGTLVGDANVGFPAAGAVTNNGVMHFDQNASVTYAQVISGAGDVLKTGAGNLTLTGLNSLTGTLTVSDGTVTGAATATTGAISYDVVNNATVAITGGTYAHVMSGTGLLNITGSTTLTGQNTYTGRTTVSGGTSILTGTTLSIPGDVVVSAAADGLTLTNTFEGTFAGVISGNGDLIYNGGSRVTLSGNNTYDGTTTLTGASTLSVTTRSFPGNSNTTLTAASASVLEFDQDFDGTFTGAFVTAAGGAGSVVKRGSGNVSLFPTGTGTTNNIADGFTVLNGTLTGTANSLLGPITVNTAVVFDQPITGTHALVISRSWYSHKARYSTSKS